jgi:hypothetical protein
MIMFLDFIFLKSKTNEGVRSPKKYHNMVIKALNREIKDLKDEFNQAEHLIQVKDDVNHLMLIKILIVWKLKVCLILKLIKRLTESI